MLSEMYTELFILVLRYDKKKKQNKTVSMVLCELEQNIIVVFWHEEL